jgi:effector-binding domain-containing protein
MFINYTGYYMKKVLMALLLILISLLAGIYSVIPTQPIVSTLLIIRSSAHSTYKYLAEGNNWIRWWPQNSTKSHPHSPYEINSFYFKEYTYQINQAFANAVEVLIRHKNSNIKTIITIVSLKNDSIKVEWQFNYVASQNPIKRIQQYQQAIEIKENMKVLLFSLKSFIEKNQNVYNINIRREKVKDTLLVATKITLVNYPTSSDISTLINRLRKYIVQEKAIETNYPMLHVTALDSSHFETMVAIPVNRALNGDSNISFKRMVPGKILVVEVKGGKYTIDQAFAQLQNYLSDYHLESPAIPFESLVTDRVDEPDSSKWITKIYFPIF